ncbi:MAG: Rieske (2Fe-2S) protein [Actinomycetota bacterium]|nr:Rieske (2Fe-2S) protein [Actinomycetota bacterium]
MKRALVLAVLLLGLSTLASLGLFVVYLLGGQPQVEGTLLFVSLGGIGLALVLWGVRVLPPDVISAERPRSTREDRDAAEAALARGSEVITRRRALVGGLVAAGGALLAALALPIRSLGPSPGRSLFVTAWAPGAGVVDEAGEPVKAETLEVGSVITVFPRGSVGSADSQAVLIRVDPTLLQLPTERETWAPGGLIAYSKICTHAGCPVALYLEAAGQLRCPCHQSTFDVLSGGTPVSGPAARPLPQLPLEVDPSGLLVARGDFSAPVGPSFWGLPA